MGTAIVKRHRRLMHVVTSRGAKPMCRPARIHRHAYLAASWLLSAGLLFAVTAGAQEIDSQVRQAALALAARGDELFKNGDYAAALAEFTRAGELVSAPTLILRQAECLEKLGRLVEAAETFRKVAEFTLQDDATEPFQLAVTAAKERLVAVEARIARLEIIVQAENPGAAFVTLNDQPLSVTQRQKALELNPGRYSVKAVADSHSAFEEVILEPGTHKQVTLNLLPAASVAPRSNSSPAHDAHASAARGGTSLEYSLGWVSLGIGAAGILTGAVTGIEVLHLKHELDRKGCVDTVCGSQQRQDVQTYNSLRLVSTTGFVVGGVGLAVGGALLYFTPRAERAGRDRLTPWLGIGSAGFSGSF